jgi:hypothetical protein
MTCFRRSLVLSVLLMYCAPATGDPAKPPPPASLEPRFAKFAGTWTVAYHSGETLVGRSTDEAPAGVQLLLPGIQAAPVIFKTRSIKKSVDELGPTRVGPLSLRWRITRKNASLVERTLEVHAETGSSSRSRFPSIRR